MASESIAHEAAIDSEPIRARGGIIVNYSTKSDQCQFSRNSTMHNQREIDF